MAKLNPNKIEDIFEETDRAVGKKSPESNPKKPVIRPAVIKPVAPIMPADQAEYGPEKISNASLFSNRRFVIAGIALIVVLLAAGAMAAWRSGLFEGGTNNSGNSNINNGAVINTNTSQPATQTNIMPVNAGPADTDGDGLTDADEKTLGTDTRKSDTDGDGLYDREEVKVYKTDPLKIDTDGDGKDDGTEVLNGYNPAGDGKLYDLTNALTNTNQ